MKLRLRFRRAPAQPQPTELRPAAETEAEAPPSSNEPLEADRQETSAPLPPSGDLSLGIQETGAAPTPPASSEALSLDTAGATGPPPASGEPAESEPAKIGPKESAPQEAAIPPPSREAREGSIGVESAPESPVESSEARLETKDESAPLSSPDGEPAPEPKPAPKPEPAAVIAGASIPPPLFSESAEAHPDIASAQTPAESPSLEPFRPGTEAAGEATIPHPSAAEPAQSSPEGEGAPPAPDAVHSSPPPLPIFARREPGIIEKLMLEARGASDPGCVRSNNEDYFLVAPSIGLYLVADGMGGAQAGEHASKLAAETVWEIVYQSAGSVTPEMLVSAFEEANRRILEAANANPEMEGMGTTLVAALDTGGDLLIASVGDSRAYLYDNGVLQAITDDQTWVNEVGRRLGLSEDALKTHPMRHVLTMAVGVSESLRVNTYLLQTAPGMQIMLCSDGLHGVAPESVVAETLASDETLEDKCKTLIEAARKNGGPDNVTVVLMRVY